jgi:hypothetical protein
LLEARTRLKVFRFGFNGSEGKRLGVAKEVISFFALAAFVTVTDKVYLPIGKVVLLRNAPMRVSPTGVLKGGCNINPARICFVQSWHPLSTIQLSWLILARALLSFALIH